MSKLSGLTEHELDKMLMCLKSSASSDNMKLYKKHLSKEILDEVKKSISIEEFELNSLLMDKDYKNVLNVIMDSYKTIKFSPTSYSYYQISKYVVRWGSFETALSSISKRKDFLDILKYMSEPVSTKKRKKKAARFKVCGCVGEGIIRKVIKNSKVNDEFLEFIVNGYGNKYFNIESKKILIKHLHEHSRFDDIYKFTESNLKTLNDFVIKMAKIEDLPFLLGADGVTAKKRVERRINKASKVSKIYKVK